MTRTRPVLGRISRPTYIPIPAGRHGSHMTRISSVRASEILDQHKKLGGGRIFTVIFIKRTNGERRVMNARFGVHRYVNGRGLSYSPKKKNLIGCYDVTQEKGKGYRMINLDSLLELKLDGMHYKVA